MNNCNLTTCRYKKYNKCTNADKRAECVKVSEKVLCIEGVVYREIENVKNIGNKAKSIDVL